MKYAFQNLFRRKLRTLFAMLGIGVGISAVIALISISTGITSGIRSLLAALPGDLMIVEDGAIGLERSRISAALIEQIENDPDRPAGIERLEGILFTMKMLPIGKLAPASPQSSPSERGEMASMLFGLDPDGHAMKGMTVKEGRKFNAESDRRGPDGRFITEFMVSKTVIDTLEAEAAAAGQPIDLIPGFVWDLNETERWQLVGIFESNMRLADLAIVVPLKTVQRYASSVTSSSSDGGAADGSVRDDARALSAVLITCEHGADLEAIETYAAGLAPRLRCLPPIEYLDTFKSDLDQLDRMIFAIGLIAALAGAIGVLNTMMSNVHERTREIGLLLAVGWSRPMVLATIIFEGFMLSMIGGLLAFGLAVLEIKAVQAFILWGVDPLPNGYDPRVFALGLGLAVTLGLAGSLLPAYFASRLRPVEALRYE